MPIQNYRGIVSVHSAVLSKLDNQGIQRTSDFLFGYLARAVLSAAALSSLPLIPSSAEEAKWCDDVMMRFYSLYDMSRAVEPKRYLPGYLKYIS